jgi:hypothetical protein
VRRLVLHHLLVALLQKQSSCFSEKTGGNSSPLVGLLLAISILNRKLNDELCGLTRQVAR